MSEKRTYSPTSVFLYALAKLIGGDKVPPIHRVFLSEQEARARDLYSTSEREGDSE